MNYDFDKEKLLTCANTEKIRNPHTSNSNQMSSTENSNDNTFPRSGLSIKCTKILSRPCEGVEFKSHFQLRSVPVVFQQLFWPLIVY